MHTLRAFDISQEQEHQALVDFVFERFSRLDILVHGASFRAPGTATGIAGLSREMGEEIIRGNLIDPLFFTQRMTQEMQHRHIPGSVIFLTSGLVPALDPASTSSNAAISMLVRELALELAGSGIRVNAVAHGTVAIKSDDLSADPLIPLGYRVMPEDIAAAVCFLASDKARFITGITLPVDGGQRLVSETYLRSRQLLKS
jgi:NAD(P)-dependent dehydrogenase (short-subunit alcohol dehydrogenase family)